MEALIQRIIGSLFEILSQRTMVLVAITIIAYLLFRPESRSREGGYVYNELIEVVPDSRRNRFLRNYYRPSFLVLLLCLGISIIISFLSETIVIPVFLLSFFLNTLPILLIFIFIAVIGRGFIEILNQRTNIGKRRIKLVSYLTAAVVVVLIFASYKIFNSQEIPVAPISDDKFSWGEDILVPQDPWAKDKKNCTGLWEKKQEGVQKYTNATDSNITEDERNRYLQESVDAFRSFVDACNLDGEARIYYNNAKALQSGENLIRFAVSVPISRDNNSPFDSQQLLSGVAIAQEEINRVGIPSNNGKTLLQIGIGDDGFQKLEDERVNARKVARYIVQKETDILGVIGHNTSDSTEATSNIYKKYSVVSISPTSTAKRQARKVFTNPLLLLRNIFINTEFRPLNLSEYVFRTPPNDEAAVDKMTSYIITHNLRSNIDENIESIGRIGIIYDGTNRYSYLYKKAFEEALSKNVIDTDVINKGVSNDDPCRYFPGSGESTDKTKDCIKKFENNQVDAVLLIPSTVTTPTLEKILVLLNNMNNRPILLSGDAMYQSPSANENTLGMVIPVASGPDQFNNFGSKKDQLNWRGAMAYDAVQALAESYMLSVKQFGGSLKNIRNNMKKSLSSDTFTANGVFGEDTISFQKNGDRHLIPELEGKFPTMVCVKRSSEGKYRFFQLGERDLCPSPKA
jgi:ABC-type branched-subunit amino acid transport system substrate-binding protein